MIKIEINGLESLDDLPKYLEKNNINLVLFAETHGFIDETNIQMKILQNIKVDVILYELLEDKSLSSQEEKEEFLLREDEEPFSIISKNKELKNIIKLANDFNVPIIGCDLKNTGRLDNSFLTKEEWSKEENEAEENLMKKRELVQYKKITEYLDIKKRVFASIGLYHLRKESLLIESLKEENFIIIYPCLKSGKKFGESMDFDKKDVYYKMELGKVYLNHS